MVELGRDFLRPDFTDYAFYLRGMAETLAIAIWGTLLAVLLGIPLGLLCAGNIAPAWVTFPVRRLMDALRAINELVFALIFIAAVGLGPFAGALALFIHTTGIIAKLFSEAVEAIDHGPVEGIRGTGATKLQEIVFGVIPQVLPLWISFTLYRFEFERAVGDRDRHGRRRRHRHDLQRGHALVPVSAGRRRAADRHRHRFRARYPEPADPPPLHLSGNHQRVACARAFHCASYSVPPTRPSLISLRMSPGVGRLFGSTWRAGFQRSERTMARAHWK